MERVLRAIVIAALGAMLWRSLQRPTGNRAEIIRARGIGGGALTELAARSDAPRHIRVRLDSVPSLQQADWLRALSGAGSEVRWTGDATAVMVGARPIASPTGGTTVTVAAPNGASVVVSDGLGSIDTVQTHGGGATLTSNAAPDTVMARVKGSVASTVADDSVTVHRVLVIGEAGWESKFVIAALEEEGWKVDAQLRVAPGVSATQGSLAAIDTARYSAVVALDSAAASYAPRIIEFVRMGGGVVLAPEAAAIRALSPLRAGDATGTNARPRPSQTAGSVTLATLPVAPITSLRPETVPLERSMRGTTIAATRFGAGRSLQVGYEDTWRWRMSGGDNSIREHRRWWTSLVSSVAFAPVTNIVRARPSTSGASMTSEAPFADLVAAIGQASSKTSNAGITATGFDWAKLLSVLFVVALLAEVASRRQRGAA